MSWTEHDQTRLNRLRDKELAGTLTAPESVELATLMARVEADEERILAPEMNRLRAELRELELAYLRDWPDQVGRRRA